MIDLEEVRTQITDAKNSVLIIMQESDPGGDTFTGSDWADLMYNIYYFLKQAETLIDSALTE